MPRGGHMGLLKPTPKDIFRSRWKRFYKRCYRKRSQTNAPERPGPHFQPMTTPDGVPSPWRLLYASDNFEFKKLPPDIRPHRMKHYSMNERAFLKPMEECRDGIVRDCILRSLDPGRRGVAGDTGYGRAELTPWAAEAMKFGRRGAQEKGRELPEHLPEHIYNLIRSRSVEGEDKRDEDAGLDFLDRVLGKDCVNPPQMQRFPVRRLQQLLEEWELIWENGQNNPRAGNDRNKPQDEQGIDRGRFPFIDEQAGLLDELNLKEILRLNYKTKSRHHPKWREIRYEFKKGHRQYLRKKDMNDTEKKARMGIIRKALQDS